MDRLVTLEPSNVVSIRVESGQRCTGEVTLRNVMYTMPVAFRLQPKDRVRYNVHPQSGIIPPLSTITVEIAFVSPPDSSLPRRFPQCDDKFELHSVVAPGAALVKETGAVPGEWFTNRKKQVYSDDGIRVVFVGSVVLGRLVARGRMDEVREVLERSDPEWRSADSRDSDGNSLLHLAIGQGRADLVQLLIEFGANVEGGAGGGWSPIEAAAAAGEVLIVELLLANKARPGRALHLAAGNGNTEVLRLLLKKGGADVNAVITDGDAPLHVAARLGDEEIVKMLLDRGGNKYVRNRAGKTAYDLAAENGHGKLYDCLKLGDRLCTAARKGDVGAIGWLIDNGGALINGRDQNGWTALHRAAFKGRVEAVRTLIERGLDVEARDKEGYTALHCAVEAGRVEAVEVLVKKGANVAAATGKGVTAVAIAEGLGYKGIVRMLGDSGKESGGTERRRRLRRRSFQSTALAVV